MTNNCFKTLPSRERLEETLNYDPETGIVTWKHRGVKDFINQHRCNVWNGKFAGKEAGSLDGTGYRIITIDWISYKTHRLIWKLVTGQEPNYEIDHVNGIRDDNKWCNLREAIVSENNHNRKLQKNNTSGFKGVVFIKSCNKWQGKVRCNYTRYYTDKFNTAEEANDALCKIRESLHKEFSNNG